MVNSVTFLPLLFSISIFIFFISIKYLSPFYSFDKPGGRKNHPNPISQVGGLVFGILFLIICYFFNLAPAWFILGSLISIFLGALDDNLDINWKLKILAQLGLAFYLIFLFWGKFNSITFYNYNIQLPQFLLIIIFLIWFLGIYNAVNLIDGLDGLAGGFLIIFLMGYNFTVNNNLNYLNIVLMCLVLAFIVFNQRPAKVFMGDAGSLFLGFYVAVLPLLESDVFVNTSRNILNITPYLILTTFLIADTTRVFFTRLISGKSPMNADTIHFHHLVFQKSGSYLTTLFFIFFLTFLSSLFAIMNSFSNFGQLGMLAHLAFIFLFILTPPAPTYVNIIWKTIKPLYIWQKKEYFMPGPSNSKIVIVIILFSILTISILSSQDISFYSDWKILLSIFSMLFFSILNRFNQISISSIQVFISLLLVLIFSNISLINVIIKLSTILLIISWIVFIFQKIPGATIIEYSALDLIVIFLCLGGIVLFSLGMVPKIWIFLVLLSAWFSLRFIMVFFQKRLFS